MKAVPVGTRIKKDHLIRTVIMKPAKASRLQVSDSPIESGSLSLWYYDERIRLIAQKLERGE